MEQWWNDTDRGKLKFWEGKLSHVNQKSHTICPRIEPGTPPFSMAAVHITIPHVTFYLKLLCFRRGAVEVFAVLGCRAASRCSSSPTFRESILLPIQEAKSHEPFWLSLLLRLAPICCFETLVMSYNVTLRSNFDVSRSDFGSGAFRGLRLFRA